MQLLIPFETAYPRTCLPKRCRVARVEYPLVKGHAVVTEIQPDEAQTAFRIRYPVAAALGASRSRRSTLDLLFHDHAIWWPYGGSLYTPVLDDYEGQRTFRHARETNGVSGSTRSRSAQDRSAGHNDREDGDGFVRLFSGWRRRDGCARTKDACAQLSHLPESRLRPRRLSDYAQWKEGSRRTIVVTSSGCDRAVTGRHDLYSPPASYERRNSRQALYEGRFWMPDAQEEARRRLTKSQAGYPSIEVCIPDLVSGDFSTRYPGRCALPGGQSAAVVHLALRSRHDTQGEAALDASF